jgi:hypothetical protein
MDNKIIYERCKLTIDIEEAIAMQKEKQLKNIKAVITYKSGRTEEIECKLTSKNLPTATFSKKLAALKKFPTVVKIDIIRF